MKITKKELLERAKGNYESPDPRFHPQAAASWGDGVMAGAGALGYLVLDEPELPERLRYAESSTGLLCRIETADGIIKIQAHIGEAAFLRELVLRYNARAAVLEALERFRLSQGSHWCSLGDELELLRGERAMMVETIKAIEIAYEEKP